MDDEMSVLAWWQITVIGSIATHEHFHLWWQLASDAILKSIAISGPSRVYTCIK